MRTFSKVVAFFLLGTVLSPGKRPVHSQSLPHFRPDAMDRVLYGVAYYPEYMPYDRLDKDVELMQQAGISVVRVGESSWGLWEPQDGRFEYAWMDRVIKKMQQVG